MANSDVPLADGHGEVDTQPTIDDLEVLFNGVGDDACETCLIARQAVDFDFCKTRQRPYDKIVVEVLKLARQHNPSIELSSDGGTDVFD